MAFFMYNEMEVMNMIYITGDIHGNQFKWLEQIDPVLKEGDIIIVCGDFGIGFFQQKYSSEESFYDFISEQPYTVLFIDGNHENFNLLNSYQVESWNGGYVHKIRHNLIHLMRGEIYTIEGKTFFTFGGGYSIDQPLRKENVSWWPQEMPSKQEYENGLHHLDSVDHVDYIITHTAPDETVYFLSTIKKYHIKGDVHQEFPLTTYLNDIQKKTTYTHWYFGHFHVDRELWRNQTALFNTIYECESHRIIKQWNTYEY